mmetsp:Transcript_79628/g.206856  ORF Transcript_79628/g.206856 Transcript_79628/m.206856 type:complete len:135 (-) Transcript_79628:49-453(-)
MGVPLASFSVMSSKSIAAIQAKTTIVPIRKTPMVTIFLVTRTKEKTTSLTHGIVTARPKRMKGAMRIAALGKKVNLVINYDVPEDTEEYARCVSRAGLDGQPSFAISFAADAYEEASLTHFGRRLGVRFGEPLG